MMMEGAAPLWITPLVKCQRASPDIGRYEVLQRIVTEGPNDSEIETAIELFIGPDDVPLWKRVIVRSGPLCPPVTHASFPLTDDDSLPVGNAICWAAFPEQPNHKLLCVLANPCLLCIWDVYPDQPSSVGEGQSIPLPFEATSIFSLQGEGLLIQRVETVDDHVDADWNEVEEEDGFVLKAPPRPVRTSLDTLQVPSIPSLFSLSHPMDDVLPITSVNVMISDVFEKVLFVGALSGVDATKPYAERTEFQQTICVTYHTQKKRYVGEIKLETTNNLCSILTRRSDMLYGNSKKLPRLLLKHLFGKSVSTGGLNKDGTVILEFCSKISMTWN